MAIEINIKTGAVTHVPDAEPASIGVSAEIASLRRQYLDATEALCGMAGVPYTGKLTNSDYGAAMAAADRNMTTVAQGNQLSTVKTTLAYCAQVLGRQEGEGWWDNITGT